MAYDYRPIIMEPDLYEFPFNNCCSDLGNIILRKLCKAEGLSLALKEFIELSMENDNSHVYPEIITNLSKANRSEECPDGYTDIGTISLSKYYGLQWSPLPHNVYKFPIKYVQTCFRRDKKCAINFSVISIPESEKDWQTEMIAHIPPSKFQFYEMTMFEGDSETIDFFEQYCSTVNLSNVKIHARNLPFTSNFLMKSKYLTIKGPRIRLEDIYQFQGSLLEVSKLSLLDINLQDAVLFIKDLIHNPIKTIELMWISWEIADFENVDMNVRLNILLNQLEISLRRFYDPIEFPTYARSYYLFYKNFYTEWSIFFNILKKSPSIGIQRWDFVIELGWVG